jgi:hypothetical protein
MANWVADLKSLDPTKLTTAAVVFKQTGSGSMPGLTASELQQWMTSFLKPQSLAAAASHRRPGRSGIRSGLESSADLGSSETIRRFEPVYSDRSLSS